MIQTTSTPLFCETKKIEFGGQSRTLREWITDTNDTPDQIMTHTKVILYANGTYKKLVEKLPELDPDYPDIYDLVMSDKFVDVKCNYIDETERGRNGIIIVLGTTDLNVAEVLVARFADDEQRKKGAVHRVQNRRFNNERFGHNRPWKAKT